MTQETERILLRAMEYTSDAETCAHCIRFRPADCSGSLHAKSKHCALNPAIDLPVAESGRCKHWAGAPPKKKTDA
jgi:hypothetical protein